MHQIGGDNRIKKWTDTISTSHVSQRNISYDYSKKWYPQAFTSNQKPIQFSFHSLYKKKNSALLSFDRVRIFLRALVDMPHMLTKETSNGSSN